MTRVTPGSGLSHAGSGPDRPLGVGKGRSPGPAEPPRVRRHQRPPIDNLDLDETGTGGWAGRFRDQSFHTHKEAHPKEGREGEGRGAREREGIGEDDTSAGMGPARPVTGPAGAVMGPAGAVTGFGQAFPPRNDSEASVPSLSASSTRHGERTVRRTQTKLRRTQTKLRRTQTPPLSASSTRLAVRPLSEAPSASPSLGLRRREDGAAVHVSGSDVTGHRRNSVGLRRDRTQTKLRRTQDVTGLRRNSVGLRRDWTQTKLRRTQT